MDYRSHQRGRSRGIEEMRRGRVIGALLASALAVSAAPGPRVVRIVARDYVFLAPDTIRAGAVVFEYQNDGKEPHEALLRRVPSGHTANEVFAAVAAGALPDWLGPGGGPNLVEAGGHARVRQNLEPGTYIWLCAVATGTVPHMKMGMVRAMVVASRTAEPSEEPVAATVVDMKDFAYTVKAVPRGRHWLRVQNSGGRDHELVIWRLAPGATMQDALSWRQVSGRPRPFSRMGGVGRLGPGQHAFVELDARPGKYVFRCRIPEPELHKTHFQLGMQSEITVQ
ncbi:MAG TPA: hypothetical protein VF021_01540 [Longimicrobiales bacterium]